VELTLAKAHTIQTVEFDDFNWFFRFSDDEWLRVTTLWRVTQAGGIRRTSTDHGQWFGLQAPVDAAREAEELLLGHLFQTISIKDGTADLSIELPNETMLQVITDSSGYEPWELHIEDRQLIAYGGGHVAGLS
jgi:hypothetical protein